MCSACSSTHRSTSRPVRSAGGELARVVCGLGEATVVVVHDLEPDARVWLSERLGARVISLGVVPSGRMSAIARGLVHPRRCWPPTSTDMAAAATRLGDVLGGGRPAVVWCAGAESWMALPRELRDDAIVDLIDLPSRNRGELARVAAHRLGRRITHDGGVEASIFGLARDVQGGIRNRWLERRRRQAGRGRGGGQPGRAATRVSLPAHRGRRSGPGAPAHRSLCDTPLRVPRVVPLPAAPGRRRVVRPLRPAAAAPAAAGVPRGVRRAVSGVDVLVRPPPRRRRHGTPRRSG